MFSPHLVAEVASLLSEPPRVAIVTALLDGTSHPAGELARSAGLTPQAASAHLARLTEGGLLTVVPSGRHRYYRLSRPEVAAAVEALAGAGRRTASPRRVPLDPERNALKKLRTCYDHLAGELAVAMTRALVEKGAMRLEGTDFGVTALGREWFEDFGVDLIAVQARKRHFARACLDWTEREPHLAGALGAAVLCRFRALRWVAIRRGTRALRVTLDGERGLTKWIGSMEG